MSQKNLNIKRFLILEKFHRVDLLVNNAGILNEYEPQKVMDINLVGTIYGCRAALKYMGKSTGGSGGFVINTASIADLLIERHIWLFFVAKYLPPCSLCTYSKRFEELED
ncbi:15-hydroxyprostaglandin dehydrogenase [Trichonephila clavata]|uniref:15-hydroxyprostaglandin dehydrogenase [NAD(+)] n=1 Tax=Trichonephila clavata TaxID=2740835 RepID=A0A8X6KNP1_TRICU|nr:15-hydroxyprostaglandin dehydrogenase [Trichonephila clavata]